MPNWIGTLLAKLGWSKFLVGGTLIAEWFMTENPIKKWMRTGSTPISGNLHDWLVVTGTWTSYEFPYLGNVIIPSYLHIFQKGWNRQSELVCAGIVFNNGPTDIWKYFVDMGYKTRSIAGDTTQTVWYDPICGVTNGCGQVKTIHQVGYAKLGFYVDK